MVIKQREYKYDLLRVVSMMAVIMIHVSGTWVNGFSTIMARGGTSVDELLHPLSACIYDSISRFAVPCFIMLSGAFILADRRKEDYLLFYKKSFYKLGTHTLIFTVLYTLYQILECFVGEKKGMEEVLELVKGLAKGSPMYHMWYMYMLVVLYLLAPVCVRLKNSISEAVFDKVAAVFLVVANLSAWTTQTVRLSWDVGRAFEYLGYFMIGYVIRKHTGGKENNKKVLPLIIGGVAVEVLVSFVEYYFQIVKGIGEGDLTYRIVAPYSPGIVLASVLIFTGFSYLSVKESRLIAKLSGMSFIVYLMHAGVWDFIGKVLYLLKGKDYIVGHLDNIYMIPVCVMAVFIVSLAGAEAYKVLYDKGMESWTGKRRQ